MSDYRYPWETPILALTLLVVFGLIAITSTAMLHVTALFILVMVVLAYFMNRIHHVSLMRRAEAVTAQRLPALYAQIRNAAVRLQVRNFQVFVAPAEALNAYAFGLEAPQGVVLYTGLFRVMDQDELQFIIGHELGHVSLGHTWFNSLLGGMAGIPSPYLGSVVLHFAFRWWNRACEYSADRAGLLACGRPDKAISALIKIATGGAGALAANPAAALARIQQQDEALNRLLGELTSTHPLIAHRIAELRRYAASGAYRRLQAQVDQSAARAR